MTGSYVYKGTGYELDDDAAREYIRNGYLLGPQTVLKGRTKLPQSALPTLSIDPNKLPLLAQQTLEASIGNIAGSRRAMMFSGGFDSILLVLLARKCGAQVSAVTVQFEDFNQLTVAEATQSAKEMGLSHHILHVKIPEFLSAFEALAEITDEPLLDLELGLVYAALKKYDPKIAGDVFISGMGSDQWLGNVDLKASPDSFAARLDWAIINQEAHQRVAQEHGYKFVFPFLSSHMLSLSRSIPPAMKKDKKLIRELAVATMIPRRNTGIEMQIPLWMRYFLIKKYGPRAWPCPVSVPDKSSRVDEQTLRQVILGLWLEKAKKKVS